MPLPSTSSQQVSNAFADAQLGAVCLISDLHLCTNMPKTLAQFQYFCQTIAPKFDTLIIMGDLFEYWLGDDASDANSAALCVINELSKLHSQNKKIGFIPGNRDFLLSDVFLQRAHMTLLPDPCVLSIHQSRVLLSHGDLLCTDDAPYQRLRFWVHKKWVQTILLSTPLKWRNALAQYLRQSSQKMWDKNDPEQRIRLQDVSQSTVNLWFNTYAVKTMIHGHTHCPKTHQINDTIRMVLPDWDCDDEKNYRWGYVSWNHQSPQLNLFNSI